MSLRLLALIGLATTFAGCAGTGWYKKEPVGYTDYNTVEIEHFREDGEPASRGFAHPARVDVAAVRTLLQGLVYRDGSDVRYSMHIGLATLRRDGFVSLSASERPGVITTRPLSFSGKRLFINAGVQNGGSIRVGLLTQNGEPVPGYSPGDCTAVTKGAVTIPVTWGETTEFTLPAGEHVRLKFELKKAEIFAYWLE